MKINMQGLLREVFNALNIGETFTTELLLTTADIPKRDKKSAHTYLYNLKRNGYCKKVSTKGKLSTFEKLKHDNKETRSPRKQAVKKPIKSVQKPIKVDNTSSLLTTGTEIIDQILDKIDQYKEKILNLTIDLKTAEKENDENLKHITRLQEEVITLNRLKKDGSLNMEHL